MLLTLDSKGIGSNNNLEQSDFHRQLWRIIKMYTYWRDVGYECDGTRHPSYEGMRVVGD